MKKEYIPLAMVFNRIDGNNPAQVTIIAQNLTDTTSNDIRSASVSVNLIA